MLLPQSLRCVPAASIYCTGLLVAADLLLLCLLLRQDQLHLLLSRKTVTAETSCLSNTLLLHVLLCCSPTACPGVEEFDELIAVHVQELVQVHAPERELTERPLQQTQQGQQDTIGLELCHVNMLRYIECWVGRL